MSFENVAFCDRVTFSQRKVIIRALRHELMNQGMPPSRSTVMAYFLLRISKLDADLGTCVLPCREFDTRNE